LSFTGEILNYLYLANDILQKAKSTDNSQILKAFQVQMPDMVTLVCEKNIDRPLLKEILKVSSGSGRC
jgi:CID domain